MLAFIGGLLLLYFLNAIILITITGEYISPFVILIIMVIELILFFIYSFYSNGEVKVKKIFKSKSSTKMTAEKFDMFNDLNNRK